MKSRISRFADLRQCLHYDFETKTPSTSGDPLDIVAGNCSVSLAAIEIEFGAVRALRPDVRRPYLHVSMSCPLGERLSRRTWAKVIRFVLDDVGLDTRRHQYIARRHARRRLDHCHAIVNRVALDAQIWSGEFEVWKFIKACQSAERQFGLELTVGLHDKDSNFPHADRVRNADSDSIVRANRQSQRELGRVQDTKVMTEKLLHCASRALNFHQFQELTLVGGIEVVEVVNEAWRMSGVVVRETWSEKFFKLSSVTAGLLDIQKLETLFEKNRNATGNERPVEAAESAHAGRANLPVTVQSQEANRLAASLVESSSTKQDKKLMAAMIRECADKARDLAEFQALALRRRIVVTEIAIDGQAWSRILIRETGAREFHKLSSITGGRLNARTLAIELEENDLLYEAALPPRDDFAGLDDQPGVSENDARHQDESVDADEDRPGEA